MAPGQHEHRVVHDPQPLLLLQEISLLMTTTMTGATVKFRCERDVLVEALATATRAVASRGGALPVLSGVKLDLRGDQLQLAGSDLDLTIQVEVTVAGQVNGVTVLPARLL